MDSTENNAIAKPKARVLVVDDTIVVRRMLSTIIDRDDELEVVGVAQNGRIALRKLSLLQPDIVTMDIEMPELDGIETLRELRKTDRNIPVIMLSSLTEKGAQKTFEAIDAGANDYMAKPANLSDFKTAVLEIETQLIPKLKAYSRIHRARTLLDAPRQAKPSSEPPIRFPRRGIANKTFNALCIGTSTGGPNALETFFTGLKSKLDLPIFIVQHMPPVFTRTLSERLNKLGPTTICEAEHGQIVQPGFGYMAPGGKHMELARFGQEMRIQLHEGPPENSCRPAVDVLFRSVAKHYGAATLAIIMTGMGQDGLKGCQVIAQAQGSILSQDKDSSLIWGMPRAVCEADLADEILPLDQIAPTLLKRLCRPVGGLN